MKLDNLLEMVLTCPSAPGAAAYFLRDETVFSK